MMLRSLILAFTTLWTFELQARDTKELKRAHTYNLRRWIQLLEFSQSDKPDAPYRQARMAERSRLFKKILPKLSKKKARTFKAHYDELLAAEDKETEVSPAFHKLRLLTFELFKVVALPAQVPDLELGQSVYVKHCQSCHGVGGKGDGPLTRNPVRPMNPKPQGFNWLIKSSFRSPYSFFNTIMIASNGTAMPAFDKSLKSHEIWSLAFYLSSDWIVKGSVPSGGDGKVSLTLFDLATKTNEDLIRAGENLEKIRKARNHLPFKSATKRR